MVDETLVMPEPDAHWSERLAALQEGNLVKQYDRCLFEMRSEQVERMGFRPVSVEEAVEQFTGEKPTTHFLQHQRESLDWVYDHHTGRTLHGARSRHHYCHDDMGWYVSEKGRRRTFTSRLRPEFWRCRFGQLDNLKEEIPYDLLCRINQLKAARVFNAFRALWSDPGHMALATQSARGGFVVMGSIWLLPRGEANKNGVFAGEANHFFVAQVLPLTEAK